MMKRKFSDIRIGVIARQDCTGLGYQTKAITDLLKPHMVLVIDSSPFNGREQHPEWYKDYNTIVSDGFASDSIIKDFLSNVDVVISCEVPYNNNLYTMARKMGVKTALQPNAELNPHFNERWLPKPDFFILPSHWYERETRRLGVKTYVCPPPIDLKPQFYEKYKSKDELNVLHMLGKRAAYDRNGSDLVAQLDVEGVNIHIHDQALDPIDSQSDIYEQQYDLVLIPRKYGGLCLPMYESLGYGLPVVMTNIDPNYRVLPKEWLVDCVSRSMVRTKTRVISHETNVTNITSNLIGFRDMDNETFQVEKFKARKLYEEYQRGLDNWFKIIEEIANT